MKICYARALYEEHSVLSAFQIKTEIDSCENNLSNVVCPFALLH